MYFFLDLDLSESKVNPFDFLTLLLACEYLFCDHDMTVVD